MGRLERPLDEGPLLGFAQGLRDLRAAAGSPTYRELARIAHVSQSALSAAASGQILPTWEVTAAYVRACGGDSEAWRERWSEQQAAACAADPDLGVVALGAAPQDGLAPERSGITALAKGEPRRVGRFRLRGRLGSGAMGVVYLGVSPVGRPVAVKVIRAEYADDPVFRRRFTAELQAARAVAGGYTPALIDADTAGRRPWMATVFIPGPSLAEVVEWDGPLSEPVVWGLAGGIAEALVAIHAAGIAHRDLKPSNVLLDRDGPKVIDFGICRAMDGSTLTRTGGWVGTAGYTAPERATRGESLQAGDIFALGAVLAYAATGHPPFGQGPVAEVLYRVVHQPPASEALDVRDRELRALIEACLAKDPAQRPTPAQVVARCNRAIARDGTAVPSMIASCAAARDQHAASLLAHARAARRISALIALSLTVLALATTALAVDPWSQTRHSSPAATSPMSETQMLAVLGQLVPATNGQLANLKYGTLHDGTRWLGVTYYGDGGNGIDLVVSLTPPSSTATPYACLSYLPPDQGSPRPAGAPSAGCTVHTARDGGAEMIFISPAIQGLYAVAVGWRRPDGLEVAVSVSNGTEGPPLVVDAATPPGTLPQWEAVAESSLWHD
jgi:serine/threonine protein kinase